MRIQGILADLQRLALVTDDSLAICRETIHQ
jgi:hypothetical protein